MGKENSLLFWSINYILIHKERGREKLAGYLKKYVGTYRVIAEYDQSTNDFCRLVTGELDPSFDDYYIAGLKGVKISHAYGRLLQAYIPSIGRGRNILKQIYEDYIGGDIDKFKKKISKTATFDYDKMYQELINKEVVLDIDETSVEITFLFKATKIEQFEKYLKPRKSGASISPFSTKNLPKNRYKIPEKDLKIYEQIVKLVPKERMLEFGRFNNKFDKVVIKINKAKDKKYDLKSAKRKSALKSKEFYHSIGLWEEYITFLKNEVKKLV